MAGEAVYYMSTFEKLEEMMRISSAENIIQPIDLYGARSRGRTGTTVSSRGILSPLRLPISPSGHGGDGQRHSESICINAFTVPGE